MYTILASVSEDSVLTHMLVFPYVHERRGSPKEGSAEELTRGCVAGAGWGVRSRKARMAGGVSRGKRERRRGRRQQEKEKAPLVTKERETDVEIGEAKNNSGKKRTLGRR